MTGPTSDQPDSGGTAIDTTPASDEWVEELYPVLRRMAVRQLLSDHIRKKTRQKRGGEQIPEGSIGTLVHGQVLIVDISNQYLTVH